MVRPSDRADREPIDGTRRWTYGTGRLRNGGDLLAWNQPIQPARSRALRVRTTAASAGDFAVVKAELRRPHSDRSDFGHPLHRRQLAGRTAHRSRFFRWHRQLDRPDVQLLEDTQQW